IETYNWLGNVPKMREWVSDRQLSGLLSHNYSITNKHYEASIEVERDTYEDDKLNLVSPRIRQLGAEAARFEDELTINAIINGTSSLCYDGQFFFDTDHAEGNSGTQSNLLTGTGTTLAQIRTDWESARAAMQNFKDDEGRPMSIMPTHILAPPALEGPFRQLLNSEFFNAGAVAAPVSNVWKGTADLIITPYLTDAADWYVLALNHPVKPLMFQMRKHPEFVALDSPTSEQNFLRKRFMYGVDARYNVGYSFWQLAIKVNNA
ncbi:MAG TPA: Mu-like prophage major head subunit gpT family protein, partial [Phycisphaerales bacterium]|nr:Mu-like prophage major head subunit gpT family protein [Phycisphaerales bacterium]